MPINIAAIAALACLCASRVLGQVTVTALPDDFHLTAISDNGRIAVGNINMSGARWTAEGELTVFTGSQHYSRLEDISADGLVAVGTSGRYGPAAYFRGSEQIGHGLPGDSSFYETARKVSANGRVITGIFYNLYSPDGTLARWELDDDTPHRVSTGLVPGATIEGLSGDGAIMTGTRGGEAYVWSAGTGAVGLGQLTLGDSSRAEGLSRDGSVVFGMSGNQVFRWTRETGMVALSGPGEISITGLEVNNDGSLAVGFGQFLWSAGKGFVPILQWLSERGADMDGWSISELSQLSGDGSSVAGSGRDPDGVFRNFIITGIGAVPEPSTYGIGAVGALVLAVIGRRKIRESRRFDSLRSVFK